MKIKLYQDDLPNNLNLGLTIAIDTETMGLNPIRDKLCLVQISKGNNISHLVKINDIKKKPKNLIKILKNNKIKKIFHFARFDVAVLKHSYGINIKNIYCTKIASKIIRTYTDKHGYKDLCLELLKKTIINKGTKFVDEYDNLILDWPRPKKITENKYISKIPIINVGSETPANEITRITFERKLSL